MYISGAPSQTVGHCNRVVQGTYWLVIIALVATYTGNLTASLAIHRHKWPFNTLDEFANAPDWPLYVNRKELVLQVGMKIALIHKEDSISVCTEDPLVKLD